MRLKVIACNVLLRELCLTTLNSKNNIDLELLPQGLHVTPDKLRESVQKAIDKTEEEGILVTEKQETVYKTNNEYDAILLGYGLCSNGLTGISSKKTPLVIIRSHDCITHLLGSKDLYQKLFDENKGVYWYSAGWIEKSLQPSQNKYELTLAHYIKKYGEDNANYLMEMEQNWYKEYNWAFYIDWDMPKSDYYRDYTKKAADYLNWGFKEIKGNPELLQNFLDGNWNNERFLVIPPGEEIAASHDELIMCSTPGCSTP